MNVRNGDPCGCGRSRCGNYGTLGYLARSRAAWDGRLTGCNGQNIYYEGPCGCVSSACSGVCYPWQDCACGCDGCIGGPWNRQVWDMPALYGGPFVPGMPYAGYQGCAAGFTGRCAWPGGGFVMGFARGSAADFDLSGEGVRFRWAGRYMASFNVTGCAGDMALTLNGSVLGASRSSGGFGQAVFEANSGDCLSVAPADGCVLGGAEGVTLIIYRIG